MTERIFCTGNEAIGWGAVTAGCLYFFGYPITPQNEVTAWFARELPERGGVFVQAECETGSINLLYGAAAAGARTITSTSSPGWGLMQEGMSNLAAGELPCVIAVVQRGGPGAGTINQSQMDYLSVTRGGGGGGYKNIVLAPSSVQDTFDLAQVAFHLADKWRNPVILLTDSIIGQVAESMGIEKLEFDQLPEKDWALRGKDNQVDGERRIITCSPGSFRTPPFVDYLNFMEHLNEKYRKMSETETRSETYQTEDAELVIVSFGYTYRVSREAVDMARNEGIKVGLLRPITLWPFPDNEIKNLSQRGCRFLVVEDNLGQMIDDVRLAVEGRSEISLLGMMGRHSTADAGMILPERVFEEVKNLI